MLLLCYLYTLFHAFNNKKCKLQTITRKRKPICTSYEVNGSTIKSCEEERDLGVSLDCDLTWHAQVSHQATLANKLLGFVRRNCRFIHSTSVRHTLYLGLVHAHLGYATQVWALQGIELISKLKSIQRRATYLLQRKTNVSKPSSCVLLARVTRSSILLQGYA